MKLTLDKSWELCLKQWRWIAKQVRAGRTEDINRLKELWLDYHNIELETVDACFFCEYANKFPKSDTCQCCPATKIDKSLEAYWCLDNGRSFNDEPLKFYAKLLELNRKRKKK